MSIEEPRMETPWSIDPELRAILVCPACRGELEDQPAGLRCPSCELLYPVVDDIPQLIAEEARPSPSAD
jgi:uncharacterized protein YbaR (Trm112 family)